MFRTVPGMLSPVARFENDTPLLIKNVFAFMPSLGGDAPDARVAIRSRPGWH